MRAALQEPLESGKIRCNVCAFRCELSEGQTGICRVRKHEGGEIKYLALDTMAGACIHNGQCGAGTYCAEKPSCNWSCSFCTSAVMTQPERFPMIGGGKRPLLTIDGFLSKKPETRSTPFPLQSLENKTPVDVVEDWKASGERGFGMRASEPSIHFEWCREVFQGIHDAGGFVAINTNGYWTPELTRELAPLVDIVNVGLKGSANTRFAQKTMGVPRPAAVFETIRGLVEANCWVHISDIPTFHSEWEDDFTRVCSFIAETIPERSYPRLLIRPWMGPIPTTAFGFFDTGMPVQVGPRSFEKTKSALLLRALELAFYHVECVWVEKSGMHTDEAQMFADSIPFVWRPEGSAIRVARSSSGLGDVLQVEERDTDFEATLDKAAHHPILGLLNRSAGDEREAGHVTQGA